jgi:hypothetical protein
VGGLRKRIDEVSTIQATRDIKYYFLVSVEIEIYCSDLFDEDLYAILNVDRMENFFVLHKTNIEG